MKTTWSDIPKEIQVFLKRAALIFIIWKLIYHLFLFNGRIIDAPLTHISSAGARWTLQQMHPGSETGIREECNPDLVTNEIVCMDMLLLSGRKVVGVADPCNALELYVLYIGFLFSFPSSFKKILLFSIIGVAAIYIANIIRLVLLAQMYLHNMSARDFAHHYLFKAVVYALTFVLWVLFVKKTQKDEVAAA
ncbi:MAG: archaeosortase/exosortase family protein [Filimonas sp.]|nr:archaeosortase/exosortase family protein [Filimonas sp.]